MRGVRRPGRRGVSATLPPWGVHRSPPSNSEAAPSPIPCKQLSTPTPVRICPPFFQRLPTKPCHTCRHCHHRCRSHRPGSGGRAERRERGGGGRQHAAALCLLRGLAGGVRGGVGWWRRAGAGGMWGEAVHVAGGNGVSFLCVTPPSGGGWCAWLAGCLPAPQLRAAAEPRGQGQRQQQRGGQVDGAVGVPLHVPRFIAEGVQGVQGVRAHLPASRTPSLLIPKQPTCTCSHTHADAHGPRRPWHWARNMGHTEVMALIVKVCVLRCVCFGGGLRWWAVAAAAAAAAAGSTEAGSRAPFSLLDERG